MGLVKLQFNSPNQWYIVTTWRNTEISCDVQVKHHHVYSTLRTYSASEEEFSCKHFIILSAVEDNDMRSILVLSDLLNLRCYLQNMPRSKHLCRRTVLEPSWPGDTTNQHQPASVMFQLKKKNVNSLCIFFSSPKHISACWYHLNCCTNSESFIVYSISIALLYL